MTADLCRLLVESFLEDSWNSVKALVGEVAEFNGKHRRTVSLFRFKETTRINQSFGGEKFFLRGSVEYSNPQLTVEELQGVIGIKLLEVCGNYFANYGLRKPDQTDLAQICELLKKPSEGRIVGFLLNTDDVEADRYSMNPLRTSIVNSGQSAFPAANVKIDELKVDEQFVKKYEGKLISKMEVELLQHHLELSQGSYLDFVDSVKFDQLAALSEVFGMDLCLPALRMPLETLQNETQNGLMHHLIKEVHRDYEAIAQVYSCMGRSMNKRTTLLTVPHSKKGFGSKRAARGRLHFDDAKLTDVAVTYQDTRLYPNDIDAEDVTIAKCSDTFKVEATKFSTYNFAETPSSPQFLLYSLGSPEDAALWHGVGAFASPQLLQSCARIRNKCRQGLFDGLISKFDIRSKVPLQLNLVPAGMWVHPVHHNIDASVGCVEEPLDLTCMSMKIEHLSRFT